MNKGIDCASTITPELAEEFKADGYTFVGRYTVPEGSWKALSLDEVKAITDAGLYIVSIWETTADRALDGNNAGYDDAQQAVSVAQGLGQPVGTPIYFAVDFDAQGFQFDAIEDYMLGASEVLNDAGYELGIYGSYSVVETMAARKVATYFWQTLAWSHKQRSTKAALYQYAIDKQENGIGVDYNDSNGSAGGWQPVKPPIPPISLDQANLIIKMLSDAWNITKDKTTKSKVHEAANLIRTLSGQVVED